MPLLITVFRGIPMNNKHLEPLGGGIKIYVSDSYRFSTDTILLADFQGKSVRKNVLTSARAAELFRFCGTKTTTALISRR